MSGQTGIEGYTFGPVVARYTASTPQHAHACNCIGCCPKCGTCRTWHGHTPDYCELLQRQARERQATLDA